MRKWILFIICLVCIGCITKEVVVDPNEVPDVNDVNEPCDPNEPHIVRALTWRQVIRAQQNTIYRTQQNLNGHLE